MGMHLIHLTGVYLMSVHLTGVSHGRIPHRYASHTRLPHHHICQKQAGFLAMACSVGQSPPYAKPFRNLLSVEFEALWKNLCNRLGYTLKCSACFQNARTCIFVVPTVDPCATELFGTF